LRPFSASSINKTLKHLAAILELAVEYDLLPRNLDVGHRLQAVEDQVKRDLVVAVRRGAGS
jgi:hypothetical protein